MKKILSVVAVMAASLSASPLQAQWQTYTPTNSTIGYGNTAGYWNNSSQDGVSCNVGFIVDGNEGPDCKNQKPTGWLGTSGDLIPGNSLVLQTSGGAPVSFFFGAGSWKINLLGRVAGAEVPTESQIGVYNRDNNTAMVVSGSLSLTTSTGFVLFIDSWNPSGDPRRFYSSMQYGSVNNNYADGFSTQQFAVFTSSSNANNYSMFGSSYMLGGGRYIIGAEDNACDLYNREGRRVIGVDYGSCANGFSNDRNFGTDRDYNDFIIEVVPEPSSFALVGFGLTALVGFASRRRRA